jgi:hypothetical protein
MEKLTRSQNTIMRVLEHEGLCLADCDTTQDIINQIIAIDEYIEMNPDPQYTIYDWIDDTKTNMPEFFNVEFDD